MEQPLIVERRGPVMVLTLNRPEVKNAASYELACAMAEALDMLDADDSLSVAVLTGAGGNFCTGMDLKGFLQGKRPSIPGRGFCAVTEAPPRKILIAAVEGYALAGGFELALGCDLIVSSNAAKFGLPEVKRGLVAAAGGLLRLPKRLPYHIAMEFILTGNMLSASTAHQHGLINRLVEPGQALDAALALADEIVANGPLALMASKRIVRESGDWNESDMFDKQRQIVTPVFESEDAKEGARAFAEKRKPVWKAR